ncbi:uncharacterized protein G2W53_034997 [Senna tora]|uniref:Uncharacterized protein n=1 Tax=Senna tora TaxID=362788 RepID=A0A834SQK1_9FABA|nr:uncharacterized protein G2W53_034997 [Senna tora]
MAENSNIEEKLVNRTLNHRHAVVNRKPPSSRCERL